MNTVWLVDADNQSPAIAQAAVGLLGWPSRIVLAGLPSNIKAWEEKAGIPDTLQVESWDSPCIPDGADVLLAMAAGSLLQVMERAIIFSRDGLVAGTLGRLLLAHGVTVLAVSAMDHPGLPYPHLTVPVGQVKPKNEAPAPVVVRPSMGYTEELANTLFERVFSNNGNPASISKADFCNQLNKQGYDADSRAELLTLASAFKEVGKGEGRAITREQVADAVELE